MSATIDHLRVHQRIRVIRSFTDATGMPRHEGESGVIIDIKLHLPAQRIEIRWEPCGGAESMFFFLTSGEGPRNGHMREFFEVTGEVHPAPDESFSPQRPDAPAYREPLEALLATGRFDEARTRIPDLFGRTAREAAGALTIAAQRSFGEDVPALYEWLRDEAIHHWHAWGSEATSGGDGAARMLEIGPALAKFKSLDRQRNGEVQKKT